jgi:hypothetical protein
MIFSIMLDNNICAADKESSEEESSIVVRVLKPMVWLLTPISIVSSHIYYGSKPCGIEPYTSAQRWFDDMNKKYPVADLHRTEFCVDDIWGTIDRRIFFPKEGVEEIETIYSKKNE